MTEGCDKIKVCCIGAGVMGGALMKSVIQAVGGENLTVTDFCEEKAQEYAQRQGCRWAKTNRDAVHTADVIFIAVKPPKVQSVIEEVGDLLAGKTVISMAAGVSLKSLQEFSAPFNVGDGKTSSIKLFRIMPNIPAVVGEGMIALCCLEGTEGESKENLEQIVSLLAHAGRVEIVEEKLMDAVTAISGSGPAYAFIFIEALADAAVSLGMTRNQAYIYAAQTLKGAATYMLESNRHPGELKDAVCSPAGTTIAAVEVLEKEGFRAGIMAAAKAAYDRSKELGSKK
ncbi:MAG: pyrroline-5-carboxylate reductase [Candidatus Treponema excrementipullorum]|uniref:Pyrroline-5-carboxylate reductase n=1 Tax=Candidatus Treponema excrementipullorum TaxID=2838768 RepID=A0A9E2L2Y2_9SPIR|nr:pyrroline-5-carboxylate reductase [Candidatus Treponema excrementipullorum]